MLFWVQALVKVGIIVGILAQVGAILLWVERKQSAMMQDRMGPNRAFIPLFGRKIRAAGLIHSIADGIKMVWKEDWRPPKADKWLYAAAPIISIVPPLCLFAVIPFGPTLHLNHLREMYQASWTAEAGARVVPLQIADLDVGILFIFAVAGAGVIGAALAGWSSDNKFSLLGGLRAASQMVSYEVAMGLSLVGAFMVYQSPRIGEMVDWQVDHVWGIFAQPLAFVLFATAAIAETKRVPFDVPEGESEVVAGYFTEYSGLKFGMFAAGELVEVCTAGAILTTVFLGGWHMPFLTQRGVEVMISAGRALDPEVVSAFVAQHGDKMVGFDAAAELAQQHAVTARDLLTHCGSSFAHLGTSFVWHWPHWAVVAVGAGNFLLKVLLLVFLQLQIRWTLPRFRYDQIMKLGWRVLLPAALVNVLATGTILLFLQAGRA
ncbi:MAG: NADH-quinone oxidoreductase subunit H [Deltaproteobacteria bacterium]|nr:NADH-quinone oxidoreductase subunit H [Deltaproteobacteria bacterium]